MGNRADMAGAGSGTYSMLGDLAALPVSSFSNSADSIYMFATSMIGLLL